MRCDFYTVQSIKDWHKLGLGSILAFWMVTINGAITSTSLVILSQKSIDALNSYGQLLLDFVMKFKTNSYNSESDEIR